MAAGSGRTINAITVPIRTDISGFSKGLKDAKDAAKKTVTGLLTTFSPIGPSIKGALDKVHAGLDQLKATNLGILTLQLADLSVKAFSAAKAMSSSGFKRIGELGDVSLQLGIASDKLSELQFAAIAAGASAEDMNGFLKGLNATVHASIGQLTPASEAFKRLGTSAEELNDLSPDQQFARLKAGFDALPDAASKATAAVQIGGEAGLKLFKLLGMSAQEFEAIKQKSKDSGFTVKPEDLAKVQEFNSAWETLKATFDGVVNQLTVAVAPAVKYVARVFSDWLAGVSKDSKFFDRMIDGFVGALGRLADVPGTIALAFQDAFAQINQSIGKSISWTAKLLDALSYINPAMKGVADGVRAAGQAIEGAGKAQENAAKTARAAFEKSKPSIAINDAYKKFKEGVAKAAEETAKNTAATQKAATANNPLLESVLKLKQAFANAISDSGLTAEQKQIAELKRQGASLRDVIDLEKQAAAVREAGKRDSLAEDLRESTKTPMQKLGEDLARINQLVKEGKLTQAQALKGAAQKTAESGVAGGQVQFAGATQSNSAEGRSYLLSQTVGKPESMLETAKKGLDATMQGNTYLAKIAQTLGQAIGGPAPTSF